MVQGPGAGIPGKIGEERLKEMEAEMALFEQEVLGAPVTGIPTAVATVPTVEAMQVPAAPVIRPIIATNTYQQLALALVIGVTWTVQRLEKPCSCGEQLWPLRGPLSCVRPSSPTCYREQMLLFLLQQEALALWLCGPLTRLSWAPLCLDLLDHL